MPRPYRRRCKAGISVRHSVYGATRRAQPVSSPAAPEEEGTQVTTPGERAGAQPPGGGRTLFVRNATGLVRELSAFDAFNLVFSAVLIPVGITQVMGFAPPFWPQANMHGAF